MSEEKRIYCVVAQTVQNPLLHATAPSALCPAGIGFFKRVADTRSVIQVPGRIAAQVGHAVSRMRYNELAREIEATTIKALTKHSKRRLPMCPPFEPITTIVLGARDSFELEHVYGLLRDVAGILAYKFNDTNFDVYGDGEVTTAFATVPVEPALVVGILDYLPLWSPQVVENAG